MHPDRAGAAAGMTLFFHPSDQLPGVDPFPPANFQERVPQLRLQPHAGSAAARHDVPVDQSTARHGTPSFCTDRS
jgi:hypothetical protein